MVVGCATTRLRGCGYSGLCAGEDDASGGAAVQGGQMQMSVAL